MLNVLSAAIPDDAITTLISRLDFIFLTDPQLTFDVHGIIPLRETNPKEQTRPGGIELVPLYVSLPP